MEFELVLFDLVDVARKLLGNKSLIDNCIHNSVCLVQSIAR